MPDGHGDRLVEPFPLTVISVTYNCARQILECLASIQHEVTTKNVEVIVVDNASNDGTLDAVAKEFPFVTSFQQGWNSGFAKAVNRGLRERQGSGAVLLLNPDTRVPNGALCRCLDRMRMERSVGILGCRLVREDGTLDHACKRMFPDPVAALLYFLRLTRLASRMGGRRDYLATDVGEFEEHAVDAVNGAFLMISDKALEDVGPMDESFWMYGEDLDWCKRASDAGFTTLYFPDVTVTHLKGAVSGKPRRFNTNLAFHRSMWIYFRKHGSQNPAVWLPAGLAIASKFAVSVITSLLIRGQRRARAVVMD